MSKQEAKDFKGTDVCFKKDIGDQGSYAPLFTHADRLAIFSVVQLLPPLPLLSLFLHLFKFHTAQYDCWL